MQERSFLGHRVSEDRVAAALPHLPESMAFVNADDLTSGKERVKRGLLRQGSMITA